MLQRIQTVYLALAFIVSGILPIFISLWTTTAKVDVMAMHNLAYISLFGISALLTLVSIFSYRNRQNQFVINRLNMILNFILIGLLVYHSLTLSGEAQVSEKGIGMLLPIFSIVFLVLANKAIKKDEDLVKSVDRIR
ncbi:Probable transmembrane protein of unknown function [Flavobacterium indicum GPTSA100-9 = DSM 17447]|uniref:Transcription termination factor Rho n=1 Tax=Flavobacterium indicum (strain DSM 17447 / CIP 109464 / GPTSA100-9) TaxID=1094466 RepID=H8XQY4_FLAIG|nr:DUF4293 domain-containing protein [Flavobacterium indicum]CCG53432.1 Probable transmembrane protein of unknown function [Flavobacterium indicum GPTSA100-9 = DSM 17447]